MMLRLQKRLAASVLRCGKGRVWLDPNETNEIAMANSRFSVRKLISDGLIIKKGVAPHSRSRIRLYHFSKRLGRHCGVGKRKGSKGVRQPPKLLWMRRQRVLRRLLRKLRDAKKIDSHMYHNFYMRCKGNQFKNKRVLLEAIHAQKNAWIKQKAENDLIEALRAKAKLLKEKRKSRAAAA
ncbi:60S ribosomal protein L19, putative [Theileria equi strain WA]|uniref:Ribosomal protein L19 n=1 Tax=Theileria equi strain WA TaxID=1537102 RepID=L1LB21_THEEQ|nr:60S ribosomal protein L19, putative [Theileria equi strain WA]EKX72475.1 60S ribosomal protein L19, putative [Theileria equi strain WA]|eukprot:XP_004831927.1 60S ribosomal protein L19, putative [Theileria equi strain WA]